MNLRAYKTTAERRKALEGGLGVDLSHIGQFSLDDGIASTRNCENMIGVSQVPMGVAGPLKIITNYELRPPAGEAGMTNDEYYIPLATTEGALVASVSRGCKAITESGGAQVDSHRVGATRGPVFSVHSLEESRQLSLFLDHQFDDLKRVAEETSGHLTLKKITSQGVGQYRYVRFFFDTQDAMGMNMATIATTALCGYIHEKIGVRCLAVAGNFDIDKKSAWLNFIENRGTKVWAEVTLSGSILNDVLKTTAAKMYDVWLAKCMIGSALSGSMGFNAQYANVVAAMFLATGQDLGHIGEGSIGITTAEVVDTTDLYMSVVLPDLMVGTVGGGTGLATQKEALQMLGVFGGSPAGEEGEHAQKFAEIVGAACLAGEISLLASLSEGSLTRAHKKLARGGQS